MLFPVPTPWYSDTSAIAQNNINSVGSTAKGRHCGDMTSDYKSDRKLQNTNTQEAS